MIPKIIHYCWFGPNPFPDIVKMCIDTWKVHLPDYKFMLWNENNSPMSHPFVQAAYSKGKYAFVSDYIRIWAVNKYGGIYLDTDMYVIKPFEKLLYDEVFFGYEDEKNTINAAIFGSIQDSIFLNVLLEEYNNVKIVYDFTEITIPIIATNTFNKLKEKDNIKIYNYKTFYPLPQKRRRSKRFLKYASNETYTIHLWNVSWLSIYEKIILRFIWAAKYLGLLKNKSK
jgi:Mannosyltransferase OCH1 and related enzymes